MQIYVCVKHVPDTASNIRPLGGIAFDETIKYIMNPYDENALEQALRVRDAREGSEVIAVTVGKDASVATLRTALAMGADRAIHVKTESYFTDSIETAHLLKYAIEGDGSPGLIFAGRQSVDTEGMQIPYRLAALMDMPVVVNVIVFSLQGDLAAVERELEGGQIEAIDVALPCVIGTARRLNQPRYPSLSDVMKAKKKSIKSLSQNEMSRPPLIKTEIIDLQPVSERGKGKILRDTPEQMACELLRLLKDEAKVL